MCAPVGVFRFSRRVDGRCFFTECLIDNSVQGGEDDDRLVKPSQGLKLNLQAIVARAPRIIYKPLHAHSPPPSRLHSPQQHLHRTHNILANHQHPPPRPPPPAQISPPTSDKAAQPAIMKPVVSAFNAWTWYATAQQERKEEEKAEKQENNSTDNLHLKTASSSPSSPS